MKNTISNEIKLVDNSFDIIQKSVTFIASPGPRLTFLCDQFTEYVSDPADDEFGRFHSNLGFHHWGMRQPWLYIITFSIRQLRETFNGQKPSLTES